MKKKAILFIAIVLSISFVLAGCGKETTDKKISDDSRKAYEGTTLRVLLKTGYEAEAVVQFGHEFENTTGIKLEYEIYDEPTMRNKFILDANSQTGSYDIVATQFWYIPEYLNAGYLEPLNTFIEDISDDEWNSIDYIPENLLDTYRDSEGKLYSIPVSSTGGILMYRKDIFEKHNLEVPKTTKDVLEVAELISEKEDIFPFIARGDSSSASFGTTAGWAWAYGARLLDNDGNVTVDTPEMKKAMDDFVELMSKFSPPDQAAIGWDIMSEIFRQGKAAMNIDMSGFPGVYADPELSKVSKDFDVALLKGPESDSPYLQWIYGEGLGISQFSKNKEAAWLFLQWRNSLEISEKEVEAGLRYDFPDTRVYKTETYKNETDEIDFFTSQLPDILESTDVTYWPNIPEFEKVSEAFQKQISLAISGRQTVDKALSNAQKDIENIVEQSK